MKHRRPSLGNDQGPDGDPAEGQTPRWHAPFRFGVGAIVVVSVTYTTGSVADGVLAVSSVAAAAYGVSRLTSPT